MKNGFKCVGGAIASNGIFWIETQEVHRGAMNVADHVTKVDERTESKNPRTVIRGRVSPSFNLSPELQTSKF